MMMKTVNASLVVLFTILCGPAANSVSAREQPLRFVHALQTHGYGDMAVEYLKLLASQPNLPAEIRDVLDLEMSKSLKSAANAAFDAKEYEALMEESQKSLAKFIREKPNHPEAVVATAAWGDFLMKRALDLLRAAKAAEGRNKKEYQTNLADVRKGLTDSREKFQQAEAQFKARLAALPPPSKLPTQKADRTEAVETREAAETNLSETQFQLALIDYYLAQTYSSPKDAARVASLQKAAQAFDDIFQRNRGNVIGLYSHMWHGKTTEELGDLPTALDIFDEVLANAPEPVERGPVTGLEPLFAQVEHFRLMIVAKQKPQRFLSEALAWLKDYRRLKPTEGYQGIAVNVVKATLVAAEKATGREKAKLTAEALQLATECSKIRSPYQQELVSLRRDILKTSGRDLEVNNFEEAVVLADSAAAASDWPKALEVYNKAIAIAEQTKLNSPGRIAAVQEAIGRVQFMIARDLFNRGKLGECVDMVGRIVRDEQGNVKKESLAAAQASALGVTAALNLYVAAPDAQKPAALDRLMKVAAFTETNWPDKPEADDARMARGQAKLAVGKVDEAIEIFERVNPKSDRYPVAMYMSGANHWRRYAIEKSKAGGAPNKDQMAADRAKAERRLAAAMTGFRSQFEPGKPMPKYMFDTQLLLAELYSEGGQTQQAANLYQPLVEAIETEKPQAFDLTTIRVFLGAVRTYCALNQLDKAGDVSAVLLQLGPDTLQINDVLVEFAKLLNIERRKAEAQVTELQNAADAQRNAAQTRLASIQALLATTLVQLSQRKELGLGHMMFIGETLNTLGKDAEASQQFQKILKRAETDPEFAARAQKAMSLLRTELLKVLRKQQKYDEALQQVDQLIKENPRALEPLMEKGRILEAWAEKDPAKFAAAVGHWAMLRTRLQSMKKKPGEYYDVMYNVAKCLVREAEMSNDKTVIADRAKKAEQVLKSALILSPKLNGPDTVAQYKVLLNKAIVMQGRSPDPSVDNKEKAKP